MVPEKAWSGLSEEEKVGITEEVADVVKIMWSVTSSVIQSVDGSSYYPGFLFFDIDSRGPFHSDTDLWNALSCTLHYPLRKSFPQQALQNLKSRFSKCEPHVFTNCGLSMSNIMARDGKLIEIHDWGCAAYSPVWYEYISASWGFMEMDREWKGLLRERLYWYKNAKAIWRDFFHLRGYPYLDEGEGDLGGGRCLCSQCRLFFFFLRWDLGGELYFKIVFMV